MNKSIPAISDEIKTDHIKILLDSEHEKIQHHLVGFHVEWLRSCYDDFKDYDKFLIIIYLVNETMSFYNRNLINLNYDNYYSKNYLEIEKINILKLSRDLRIPKESTRRKIMELEKRGVIKKFKKKIIIDRTAFEFVKPKNSIKSLTKILFEIIKILNKKNILKLSFSTDIIEENIKKHFTFCWHHFYKYQIPFMIGMKSKFLEIDILHIWAVIYLNKIYNIKKDKKNLQRKEFNSALYNHQSKGINAMSISDMTGIPRPTVIRKLKYLINKKYIFFDDKKLYHLSDIHHSDLNIQQTKNLYSFANLASILINKNIFN